MMGQSALSAKWEEWLTQQRAGLLFRQTLTNWRKSWSPTKRNETSCPRSGITPCSSAEPGTD